MTAISSKNLHLRLNFLDSMKDDYCVIMAGGVGSRFWPVSTQKTPKQFLDILGTGESLLQLTCKRVQKIVPLQNILVVTNEEYCDLVKQQLPNLPEQNILAEPVRRNTAPCITYAAFRIKKESPDASMIVTPSDHLITDEDAYIARLKEALNYSRNNDYLITLGIKPTRPETGYGYIQYKDLQDEVDLKKVKTFTEKPDAEHAKMFIESGDFLWNSGVFIWNVDTLLNNLKKHLPDVFEAFNDGWDKYNSPDEAAFIQTIYPQCLNVSIDYGLMEKAENVFVLPAEFGWSDLGTWTSVNEKLALDEHENAFIGKKILLYNSKNCLVVNQGKKLIVAEGLDGYVIAEGEKAILIYPKNKEQEIKGVVNDVRAKWGEAHI